MTFDNGALDAVFRVSKYLKPNSALPEGPIRALEDYSIYIHAKNPKQEIVVTGRMIYDYAQKITGLPVNPLDAAGFSEYIDGVRAKLNERVVNQEPMVKVAVDALERALSGDPRKPVSVLFAGPTGVGKTLVGQSLAEFAFNDKNRFFEIDGTALQDGKYSLGSIFGVPTGIQGADVSSGELMEWMDDPARGKFGGIILINEADKMHLDGWKRLMEFLDRGALSGGDGKLRYGNRHIVIFTSNKGTKKVFPDSFVGWSDAEIETRAKNTSTQFLKNMLLERDLEPSKNEVILTPEIVGRIDLAALALPVTKTTAPRITEIETREFLKNFKATYDVDVEVSKELNAQLGLTGVNFLSGARNIRNQVSEYLTPALNAARKKWALAGGHTLKLSLEAAQPGQAPQIEIEFNGEKITSPAPQLAHENPLEDPTVRDMLAHLSEKMHSHMPEQPEAVDIIVSAVHGKYGDVNRKRPISILLVGRTGLGKTEIGKALGFAVYGDTERYSAIPMSDVVDEQSWNEVFIPQFERALMNNPQGGVIIPDEFSNVGGGNVQKKKALLLKFLHLLEEGTWVSPVDPTRVYDLRKYIVLFTGNDLETLTQGVTSDEENLNIWKDNHSRAKVETHLKANGVPESFLSRQDAVLMIKPLTGEGKGRVTDRILIEISNRLMKQHKGVKFKWGEKFTSQMGHSFFTHARGARSVRSVLENTVAAMVTEVLTKFGYDQKNLDGSEIHFSITDNAITKPYIKGHELPQREVILTAELYKGGERRESLSVNATESAEPIQLLTEAEADLASYHELGHALLNDESLTGLRLVRISIRGRLINGESVIGYNRYDTVRGASPSLTRRSVLARLKMLWGGRLAQEKANFDPDSGWETDLANMRQIATDYFKKYGLKDGLEAMNLDSDGRPQPSREQTVEMQTEMKALFDESRKMAEQELEVVWPKLLEAHALLKERGDIEGSELHAKPAKTCADELK